MLLFFSSIFLCVIAFHLFSSFVPAFLGRQLLVNGASESLGNVAGNRRLFFKFYFVLRFARSFSVGTYRSIAPVVGTSVRRTTTAYLASGFYPMCLGFFSPHLFVVGTCGCRYFWFSVLFDCRYLWLSVRLLVDT